MNFFSRIYTCGTLRKPTSLRKLVPVLQMKKKLSGIEVFELFISKMVWTITAIVAIGVSLQLWEIYQWFAK